MILFYTPPPPHKKASSQLSSLLASISGLNFTILVLIKHFIHPFALSNFHAPPDFWLRQNYSQFCLNATRSDHQINIFVIYITSNSSMKRCFCVPETWSWLFTKVFMSKMWELIESGTQKSCCLLVKGVSAGYTAANEESL